MVDFNVNRIENNIKIFGDKNVEEIDLFEGIVGPATQKRQQAQRRKQRQQGAQSTIEPTLLQNDKILQAKSQPSVDTGGGARLDTTIAVAPVSNKPTTKELQQLIQKLKQKKKYTNPEMKMLNTNFSSLQGDDKQKFKTKILSQLSSIHFVNKKFSRIISTNST